MISESESIVATIGSLGAVGGLIVAIGLFVVAAWLVSRASKGNRHLRNAKHEPHAGRGQDRRDIKQ